MMFEKYRLPSAPAYSDIEKIVKFLLTRGIYKGHLDDLCKIVIQVLGERINCDEIIEILELTGYVRIGYPKTGSQHFH